MVNPANDPTSAAAQKQRGNALLMADRFSEAVPVYHQALQLDPNSAELHANLGYAYFRQGLFEQALPELRTALERDPNVALVHAALGETLTALGRLTEALAAYESAIRLQPNRPETHVNLGIAFEKRGDFGKAAQSYAAAIQLRPNYAEAHNNLGNALQALGQIDQAIAAYGNALQLKPAYPQAYANLGNALRISGRLDEAIASLQKSLELNPRAGLTHNTLGVVYLDKGMLDEAAAEFEIARKCSPELIEPLINLGTALAQQSQIDEVVSGFRQVLADHPECVGAHSSLIYSLYFHLDYDAQMLQEEHRLWSERFAEPLKAEIKPHSNDRNPERRPLRVGYVGADFRHHSQSFFTLPLFAHHDPAEVQLYCYASVHNPDLITQRLRGYVPNWRSVVGLPDQQVAQLVRDDQIDILVDLTLHMAGNRLLVFARKPAPVQVTWLGYPGSTGLDTMDYRISDPHLDPPNLNDQFYAEETIRLPDSFWCYDPLTDGPEVGPLPAEKNGYITFGCLNSFAKVNGRVLEFWSQVLKSVANSRMLILCDSNSARQRALKTMRDHGVAEERIDFVSQRSRTQYLQVYNSIDIALDTFPANGHTTSLDGLWMGVPVITLAGTTAISRGGLSILTNLDLKELVATDRDGFVNAATALSGDLPRLAELRSSLRQRLRASSLMDANHFAQNMESAYRQMWRRWCQS